jgi:hypothetical protein
LTDFGVSLNEVSITELPISSSDMLGIEINQVPIPGMVLLYEEHEARYEAHYTLQDWYALRSDERALEVALYRIRHSMEYQKNKAQEKKMKEDQRKK